MDEEVSGAVLGGDEAVALLVVEPLDGAVLAFGGGVHFDELGCVGVGVDVRFFGGEWVSEREVRCSQRALLFSACADAEL